MPPPQKPYYDCVLAYSTSCYALFIVSHTEFISGAINFICFLDPETSSG